MNQKMEIILDLYGKIGWESLARKNLQSSLKVSPERDINAFNLESTKGYYGALISAVAAGIEKEMLKVEQIHAWLALLQEEFVDTAEMQGDDKQSKQDTFEVLVVEIENHILSLGSTPNEICMVVSLADMACHIEKEKILAPFQTQMANLILSYLLSFFNMPIISYNANGNDLYISCIDNKYKMRIFLSEKIRDALFSQGLLMKKVGEEYASGWYKPEDSSSDYDLIVEWHELYNAVDEWKEKMSMSMT